MNSQIRLQKILAYSGIASRRKAEKLIKDGCITVNGAVITQLGAKADPAKDYVKVNGKLITKKEKPVYILLNKPGGYISTLSDDKGRSSVRELIKNVKERIYPVGRLDINTRGLLLLTNDGILSQGLTHPSNKIPKVYLVKVRGIPDEKKIKKLTAGIKVDGSLLKAMKVNLDRITGNNSWLRFVLTEGKNREIKLLCESIRHSVSKLERIKYAFLNLRGVKSGEYRHLNSEEVARLKNLINNQTTKNFQ